MDNFDWRMIKLLYQKKSLTKVAQDLYITQSALTKRLQGIEKEWDIEVVKRTSKGVVFTEDGQYLVEKADTAIKLLDEIKKYFEESAKIQERINFGMPNSFARLYLPELITAYNQKFNGVQIHTIPSSSDILVQKLIDEIVDMGIICGDYNFFGEKHKLFAEELYLLIPHGSDAKNLESMTFIEGYYNPLVRRIIDQSVKRYFGGKTKEVTNLSHIELAISMVESGLGCTAVFGQGWKFDENKIDVIKLYDEKHKPVTRNIWLMWNAKHIKSTKVQNFLDFIREYYSKKTLKEQREKKK